MIKRKKFILNSNNLLKEIKSLICKHLKCFSLIFTKSKPLAFVCIFFFSRNEIRALYEPKSISKNSSHLINDAGKPKETVFKFIFTLDEKFENSFCDGFNTEKNIFLIKDEDHCLKNICTGIHEKTNNGESYWRKKFACSKKLAMTDHFPATLRLFTYKPSYITFVTLDHIILHTCEENELEVVLSDIISLKSYDFFLEIYQNIDAEQSKLKITPDVSLEICILLDYFNTSPSVNLNNFLNNLCKRIIFYSKNLDKYFDRENSFLTEYNKIFPDFMTKKMKTKTVKTFKSENKRQNDIDESSALIDDNNLLSKWHIWSLGAYFDTFGLSFQCYNNVWTIQKKTFHPSTADSDEEKIYNTDIKLRIVYDSVINLNKALQYDQKYTILRFFFRYIKISKLELIDLEYEPDKTEKHMNYDKEIEKYKTIHNDAGHQATIILAKLENVVDLQKITDLKIKNFVLHIYDIEILSKNKNLLSLEITSESIELSRFIPEIINNNKSLDYISLVNVNFVNLIKDFSRPISSKTIILKKLNILQKEIFFDDLLNCFTFLPKSSNHIHEVTTLEVEGNGNKKSINEHAFHRYKKLKILRLISFFEYPICKDIIDDFTSIQTLEEVDLSQNNFDSGIKIRNFESLPNLRKIILSNCDLDLLNFFSEDLKFLKFIDTLEVLDLSGNFSMSNSIFKILKVFSNLKELNLSKIIFSNIIDYSDVYSNCLPLKLRLLKLEETSLSDLSLFEYFISFKNLEELHLKNQGLNDFSILNFLLIASSNLLKIDLSLCNIRICDIEKLQSLKSIQHLILWDSFYFSSNICQFLRESQFVNLEKIYISSVSLIYDDLKLIKILSRFINLTDISLYNVRIPSGSFEKISVSDFKNLKLFSIGYIKKCVDQEEIKKGYLIFGPNVFKTYLIAFNSSMEPSEHTPIKEQRI